MIASSKIISKNITSNHIISSRVGEEVGEFCSLMTFAEVFVLNSGGNLVNDTLTITNDGVGAGQYYLASVEDWQSTTGKVSEELKWISSTDITSGVMVLTIIQGLNYICQIEYYPATGVLRDFIAASTLETIAPTQGQFVMGITLNQATGTATYSYKLNNASSPTANAALAVNPLYDNSLASKAAWGASTPTNGVTVIKINAHTELFVTNVDGSGYCEF